MQTKANGKPMIWVLLIALVLIILCAAGLWAYVQSADAETGVQETSATEIPEEDEITVTWEKYDNFPPTGKEDDLEQKCIGTGLTKEEKRRLPALIEAYTNKTGPALRFPARTLPNVDGLAIVQLDPGDYAGMTEYYILPAESLDDQQMMQLIDYSAKKGEMFSVDTLTNKNCMRGGYSPFNRYLSAGEDARQEILLSRINTEGLRPDSPELSTDKMPVKGIGSVSLRPDKHNGKDTFHLYPIREMTDEELLQSFYLTFKEGYTYLKPAEDESLHPAKDVAKVRAILEECMDMPAASENYAVSYLRKDATGEIRIYANFQTALINGKRTAYMTNMDFKTGRCLSLLQFSWANTVEAVTEFRSQIQKEKVLPEAELIEIAKTLVEKVTGIKAVSAEATGVSTTDQEDENNVSLVEPLMSVHVKLEDGSMYIVHVRVSDGMMESLQYNFGEQLDQYLW